MDIATLTYSIGDLSDRQLLDRKRLQTEKRRAKKFEQHLLKTAKKRHYLKKWEREKVKQFNKYFSVTTKAILDKIELTQASNPPAKEYLSQYPYNKNFVPQSTQDYLDQIKRFEDEAIKQLLHPAQGYLDQIRQLEKTFYREITHPITGIKDTLLLAFKPATLLKDSLFDDYLEHYQKYIGEFIALPPEHEKYKELIAKITKRLQDGKKDAYVTFEEVSFLVYNFEGSDEEREEFIEEVKAWVFDGKLRECGGEIRLRDFLKVYQKEYPDIELCIGLDEEASETLVSSKTPAKKIIKYRKNEKFVSNVIKLIQKIIATRNILAADDPYIEEIDLKGFIFRKKEIYDILVKSKKITIKFNTFLDYWKNNLKYVQEKFDGFSIKKNLTMEEIELSEKIKRV